MLCHPAVLLYTELAQAALPFMEAIGTSCPAVQEFSADMNSRAVKRIDDVTRLRTAQFAEDSGALLVYPPYMHALFLLQSSSVHPNTMGKYCSDTSVLQAPCHTPSVPTSTSRWCGCLLHHAFGARTGYGIPVLQSVALC